VNAFGRRSELTPDPERYPVRRPIVPKSAAEALRPESAVPPPRRSRRARSQTVVFFNFILSTAVFLSLLGGAAFWFGKQEFEKPGPLAAARTFVVRPSESASRIGAQLETHGIITDSRIFYYGVRANGYAGDLKAGEYEIKAGASMRDVMDVLRSGRSLLYSLTIPEGVTVHQAFQKIAADPILEGDMPMELPAEGSLQADTLRFTRGTTRKEAVEKLIADQKNTVEEIWNRRQPDLPIRDINEFLTLASIVEKETGVADERSRVAAVFVNRLRKGMRLQSDPTIIYGLFGGQGKPPERSILKSDIEKETAYNTYVIDGLPPTPIAIPGRDSLEAVANPSQTSDLFFVADGTGGHVFAETLEDHNENVKRWRAIEKKLKQEKEGAEAGEAGEAKAEPSQ
jgi:UPF0755 protein